MFLTISDGPAIARVPKNASQSILMVMAPCSEISNEAALLNDIRVMFVRDPFDRLASGYSFFESLRRHGSAIVPPIPDWTCYEEFVDVALGSSDPHFAPQVTTVTTNEGVFVPNRLHWLKDIHEVWGDYYPGLIPDKNDFPHRHHCQRLATTNYRRADIETRFAADFEIVKQVISV